MFKEQIEEGVALVDLDVKEQVAFGARELGVNEGGGFERKGVPVENGGEFRREMVFEKGAGVLRGGEGGFEQLVVGLMDTVLRHMWCLYVVSPKESDGPNGGDAGDCAKSI